MEGSVITAFDLAEKAEAIPSSPPITPHSFGRSPSNLGNLEGQQLTGTNPEITQRKHKEERAE